MVRPLKERFTLGVCIIDFKSFFHLRFHKRLLLQYAYNIFIYMTPITNITEGLLTYYKRLLVFTLTKIINANIFTLYLIKATLWIL